MQNQGLPQELHSPRKHDKEFLLQLKWTNKTHKKTIITKFAKMRKLNTTTQEQNQKKKQAVFTI
jgi:hypothetical protein